MHVGSIADVAAAFGEAVRERLSDGRLKTFVLTGGSAVTWLYAPLTGLDFFSTTFLFGDERAVAPDSPDSNFGAVNKAFFEPAAITRFHRIRAEATSLAEASNEYATTLAQLGSLDVCHVGLGPDGHICSLFPGHSALAERTRLTLSLEDSPKPPPRRISLTLPALSKARELWITASGRAKAEAVCAALTDETCMLPVALAARESPRVTWFIDSEAAALLPQQRL